MIKDGSSLLTAFTVKSKRVCQLICDFNRKCVGYKTLTKQSDYMLYSGGGYGI